MAQTEAPPGAGGGGLDTYFEVSKRGSTVRTEVLAGLATWLTMAYILFVNPSILGTIPDHEGTQLAFPQVLAVTALAAGVMSILMGVFGKYPFAIAAGLGLNAFVTFTLVGQLGLTWPQAMGVIVIEGLVISVLVLTGLRAAVMDAIPMDLKRAIGVGIALFITFIGFVSAGVVIPGEGTPVTLSHDLTTLRIMTFVIGLVLTSVMVARRMRGALLFGILATTVIATIVNYVWGDKQIWSAVGPGVAVLPSADALFEAPDLSLVGNFSITGVFDALPLATALAAIIAVMLSDFFDTMGSVVALGAEAGMLDKDGRLPGIRNVLLVDGLAAAAGGSVSSSSNTMYIESAAGIAEGGRTGIVAVVVGVLFLLSLVLSPIAGMIPPEATAPALVLVGYFMMPVIKEIDWTDPGIGIPALLIIVLQPFTFNITHGIAAGFLAYTVIALLRGRWKDVHWLMYAVSAVFAWYFARGLLA